MAEGGIQTSRVTGQLETFLASNKGVLCMINPEEINTSEILTMAVLDLALTSGRSRSCSVNACEVAAKYLKSCRMNEKTKFLANFSKISKLFYDSKLDKSLPDILCDSSVPLSSKKFQENLELWNEVENVVRILNNARNHREIATQEIEHIQRPLSLISTLCNGENYLAKIFNHLAILGNIVPKISGEFDETEACHISQRFSFDTDGNFDGSPFGMLELSIQSYFGHQFFELGVPPAELELVAKKLGVSLVHSIIVSCCPKFTFHEGIGSSKTPTERGYVVLNESSESCVSFNQASSDHLSLIQLLHCRYGLDMTSRSQTNV